MPVYPVKRVPTVTILSEHRVKVHQLVVPYVLILLKTRHTIRRAPKKIIIIKIIIIYYSKQNFSVLRQYCQSPNAGDKKITRYKYSSFAWLQSLVASQKMRNEKINIVSVKLMVFSLLVMTQRSN